MEYDQHEQERMVSAIRHSREHDCIVNIEWKANRIEECLDYFHKRIPGFLMKSFEVAGWLIFMLPFMIVGYLSNKAFIALKAGWVISRDFDSKR